MAEQTLGPLRGLDLGLATRDMGTRDLGLGTWTWHLRHLDLGKGLGDAHQRVPRLPTNFLCRLAKRAISIIVSTSFPIG